MPNYSNNNNFQPFSSQPAQHQHQQQHHQLPHSPLSPPTNLRGVSNGSSIPSSNISPSIFRAGGGNMPPLGRPDPYHHPSSLVMNQETSYSGSMYDAGPNMTTYSLNSQHSNGNGMNPHQQHQHLQHHQQQPVFDIHAMNQQAAIRPNDMHGMDRSMLMMQQEAEFGINMYDSLTPADEPEMNALIAQGYSNDEAVKLIFDRRYRPYDPRLGAPLSAIGGSSLPPTYYPHPSSSMPMSYPPPLHYPGSAYASTNDNHSLQYSNDSYYGEERRRSGSHSDKRESRGSGGSKKKLVKGSVSKSRSGDQHQPQKVKASDVKQLEKMGFSKQQAVQALLENRNDLHRAADVLLSRR
jgi:hypothetical protein